jgi:hypothetical protein
VHFLSERFALKKERAKTCAMQLGMISCEAGSRVSSYYNWVNEISISMKIPPVEKLLMVSRIYFVVAWRCACFYRHPRSKNAAEKGFVI